MSEPLMGPWNYYALRQTTAIQKTSFLCRATGKPCSNATDLGYCKLTACTNNEAWNRRAET